MQYARNGASLAAFLVGLFGRPRCRPRRGGRAVYPVLMDTPRTSKPWRRTPRRPSATALCSTLLLAFSAACDPSVPDGEVARAGNSIEFRATVSTAAFDGDFDMAGYHFIVWGDGRAADRALFRAHVSDTEVLDALEALGATPGDAVGIEAWDDRNDRESPAADTVIEGPRVEITVEVPGRDEPLRLDDILIDPDGRGFDMRFGGHRENIPKWLSGCVVCLYSCPGSKIGNASYTVRDHVDATTHFGVRSDVLPEDGTEVTIRIVLLEG